MILNFRCNTPVLERILNFHTDRLLLQPFLTPFLFIAHLNGWQEINASIQFELTSQAMESELELRLKNLVKIETNKIMITSIKITLSTIWQLKCTFLALNVTFGKLKLAPIQCSIKMIPYIDALCTFSEWSYVFYTNPTTFSLMQVFELTPLRMVIGQS